MTNTRATRSEADAQRIRYASLTFVGLAAVGFQSTLRAGAPPDSTEEGKRLSALRPPESLQEAIQLYKAELDNTAILKLQITLQNRRAHKSALDAGNVVVPDGQLRGREETIRTAHLVWLEILDEFATKRVVRTNDPVRNTAPRSTNGFIGEFWRRYDKRVEPTSNIDVSIGRSDMARDVDALCTAITQELFTRAPGTAHATELPNIARDIAHELRIEWQKTHDTEVTQRLPFEKAHAMKKQLQTLQKQLPELKGWVDAWQNAWRVAITSNHIAAGELLKAIGLGDQRVGINSPETLDATKLETIVDGITAEVASISNPSTQISR